MMAPSDEERNARRRAWHAANRERIATQKRLRYAAHREELAAEARTRREADPLKTRAINRAYEERHREERNERQRTWSAAHPEPHKRGMARERAVQAETLKQARRRGYQWTGPELEIAARRDLTAKQVALMIGRTLDSVRHMRSRLRDDPKTIWLAGLDDPADAITPPGMSFGLVHELVMT